MKKLQIIGEPSSSLSYVSFCPHHTHHLLPAQESEMGLISISNLSKIFCLFLFLLTADLIISELIFPYKGLHPVSCRQGKQIEAFYLMLLYSLLPLHRWNFGSEVLKLPCWMSMQYVVKASKVQQGWIFLNRKTPPHNSIRHPAIWNKNINENLELGNHHLHFEHVYSTSVWKSWKPYDHRLSPSHGKNKWKRNILKLSDQWYCFILQ